MPGKVVECWHPSGIVNPSHGDGGNAAEVNRTALGTPCGATDAQPAPDTRRVLPAHTARGAGDRYETNLSGVSKCGAPSRLRYPRLTCSAVSVTPGRGLVAMSPKDAKHQGESEHRERDPDPERDQRDVRVEAEHARVGPAEAPLRLPHQRTSREDDDRCHDEADREHDPRRPVGGRSLLHAPIVGLRSKCRGEAPFVQRQRGKSLAWWGRPDAPHTTRVFSVTAGSVASPGRRLLNGGQDRGAERELLGPAGGR